MRPGALRISQDQRGINDIFPKEPFSPRNPKPALNMYGNLRDSFQNAGMNMMSPTARKNEENKQGGALNLSKAAQLAMAPVRRFNPDWDIGLHKELVSQRSSSADSINSKPLSKPISIKRPVVQIE